MGEYKPLGSEKLAGDEKLKRILELTYYKTNNNKSSDSNVQIVKESKNGIYGIVKEKDGYYVKKGLNESSLDYIGGLFMKNKNKFNSYAEASKRLELLKGQEELQEATKYVLKQKPEGSSEEPASDGTVPPFPPPAPSTETPPPPSGEEMPAGDEMAQLPPPSEDMGGEEMPSEEPEMGGQEGSKPSDYMTEIQKFAGKLGQELRDQKQKMESDDIKYVLNMIISAVDLEKLEEDDLDDIAKKFEPKEEGEEDTEVPEQPEMDDEESSLPPADDESSLPPAEEGGEESELGETMDKLESFINSPIADYGEIDLSKYADLGDEGKSDIQELDLDEIKKDINDSINKTLSKYFKQ